MPLRAGVTTDRAYAGFVGSPRSEEYTCHSIHVNLAARQMVAAGWEEYLARPGHGRPAPRPTSSSRRWVLGRSRALPKSAPSLPPAWAARGGGGDLLPGRWSVARPSWHNCTNGCNRSAAAAFGGAIYITGEAGMGKSRLVHEFQQQIDLHSPGLTWFLGQTDEIVRQPLNPFRYLLPRLLSPFGHGQRRDQPPAPDAADGRVDRRNEGRCAGGRTGSRTLISRRAGSTCTGRGRSTNSWSRNSALRMCWRRSRR